MTITDLETKKSTVVRTNERGQYSLPATGDARYEIKVEFPEFRTTIVPSAYIVAG